MKKIFRYTLSALFAIAVAGSINAGKTQDQVKVYIDPGHGSWGPNNRPCQTIGRQPYNNQDPDTTGFFESNTNLQKGLAMLNRLVEAGVPFDRTKNQTGDRSTIGAARDLSQHIVMSHVKIGPYPYKFETAGDDKDNAYYRKLSEIREEAIANNFDFFISIHSNAASEGSDVNYLLFIHKGVDGEETVPGSIALAKTMWPIAFSNEHVSWMGGNYSPTNMNIRGATSMNTGGVIPGSVVPGFIVEGYFHTYQPARQRAMNFDVDHHEGMLYARGLAKYLGWEDFPTGEIYGIIRDKSIKFTDPLYTPHFGTDDMYKPLNGVKVTLSQNGAVVKEYTTDNEYNGAFIFDHLNPGTYQIKCEGQSEGVDFTPYETEVVVKANETNYIHAFVNEQEETGPAVENYTDVEQNVLAPSTKIEMSQVKVDEALSPFDGKKLLRTLQRGDITYSFLIDENDVPYIYSYNIKTGETKEISTAGVVEKGKPGASIRSIGDIAFTADGYLIASSESQNKFSSSLFVNIYKWDLDEAGLPTGNPKVWFKTTQSGNWNNSVTGTTLTYTGTTKDGSVLVSAYSEAGAGAMRFARLVVSENEFATAYHMNFNKSSEGVLNYNGLGGDFRVSISPLNKEHFIVTSANQPAAEYVFASQGAGVPKFVGIATSAKNSLGTNFFKLSGHSYMVTPNIESDAVNGVSLYDVTKGLANAQIVKTTNTTLETGEAAAVSATTGLVGVELDGVGKVTDANLYLTLIRNGKLSLFSTEGVDCTSRGVYAYNLKSTADENGMNLSFDLSGDVRNATLVFVDAENATTRIELGELTAGTQTHSVSSTDLAYGNYTWYVETEIDGVFKSNKLLNFENLGRGVVVDNQKDSPKFGTLYLVGNNKKAEGPKTIFEFNPLLEKTNTINLLTEETTDNSPYRLAVHPNGNVCYADWSDNHPTVYMVNPDGTETRMAEGTPAGKGVIKNSTGDVTGTSTSGVWFTGTGENTRMWVGLEDDPYVANICGYDIGEGIATTAPSVVYKTGFFNSDISITGDENGVWICQRRGLPDSGSNNTKGTPSFKYIDQEGNELYNSYVLLDLTGSPRSALAVNNDRTLLAVADGTKNIRIYSIAWTENTPELTLKYTLPAQADDPTQLAFDAGNNLYASIRTKAAVAYSIPQAAGVTKSGEGKFEFSETSGVESVETETAVRVYPNPVTDVLNISCTSEIESVKIYSDSGALVKYANTETVDVSDLATGIYIVKVNDEKAVRVVKK